MQRSWATKINLLAAGMVLLGSAAAQQTPATTPAAKAKPSTTTQHKATATAKPRPLELVTDKDKQSYAIGLNVGKSLHRDSIDVEPKFVLQGIEDALADGKLLLTDDQIRTVMTDAADPGAATAGREEACPGGKQQKGRRGIPGCERHQRRRGHAAQRLAIQNPGRRNGSQAYRRRYRGLQLPGDTARQHRI